MYLTGGPLRASYSHLLAPVTENSLLCLNRGSVVDEVQKRDIMSEHKYSFKPTKTTDEVANI
jgi:hypothetical protein